ncbi:MAG: DUF805 domain-containing protein [Flavobacteriales bacterium]|nr:DUF805 domain-containing protein [Flavobacteriales bacterium]
MKWYLHAFKKISDFYGRSSRTEYWMFVIFNTTFAIASYILDLIFNLTIESLGFGPFYIVYSLVALIPGLALSVRRLHDTGRKGSFIFIALLPILGAIWLLVLFLMKGDDEENDYGEKPVNSNIAEFITDAKTNTIILCISLLWLFMNRIFWAIITKFWDEYYKSQTFTLLNEIINSLWMFFPLFLSLMIPNRKLKILFLIGSVLYMIYSFYELVAAHQMNDINFQF